MYLSAWGRASTAERPAKDESVEVPDAHRLAGTDRVTGVRVAAEHDGGPKPAIRQALCFGRLLNALETLRIARALVNARPFRLSESLDHSARSLVPQLAEQDLLLLASSDQREEINE